MLKRFLIIAAVIVAVLVAIVIYVVATFRARPLESLAKMSRLSMRMSGGEKQSFETPSGTLVYWTIGEGPTVLLIHGANDQAGLWAKSAARLKDSYRFVIPDLPGHGESEPATGPIRFEMMLDAIEALKEKESPDGPVALVGNSLGGWVSLLYALEHPGDVRQLVLEDAGGISYDYKGPALVATNREEARAAFDAVLSRETPIPDFILDDFVRRGPTSQIARMSDENFDAYILDERLSEIAVPVTLIWGEDDEILTLEFARQMQSMIADAELDTIVSCGHIPHNECPDDFSKLLDEALGGSK